MFDNIYFYVNGEWLLGGEAKISIFDHGLLYGDGIYEALKSYDGRVFRLEEHLDRMWLSARMVDLNIPLSRDEMRGVILEAVRRNSFREASIRPIITRGTGQMLLTPIGCTPTVLVMAFPFPATFDPKGMKVKTSGVRRIPPDCLDSKIKSLNYLNNVLAAMEAYAAGADEALMLDVRGFVSEGSRENVFIVRGGKLHTPTTVNVLDGITRRTVIQLAEQLGIQTVERDITLGEVYAAEEVFMCSTAAEIAPISEVDGRRIGTGVGDANECPGPITRQLLAAFRKATVEWGTSAYPSEVAGA